MAVGYQSFYQAQLTANISDTDLNIPLDVVPTPDEGFLVIESTVASKREIIYYTSKTVNSVVVPSGAGNGRGYDGTTATSHLQGSAVIMAPVGAMFQELSDKITPSDGLLRNVYTYTYDGTDIFINGVDQNNAANTITWTKPANLKFVEVEVVGGGGGGGGCATTTGSEVSVGGGGGGGSYAYKKIAAADLGATETVTIGAAGAAGAAGANNGGTGGTSSFDTLSAVGGNGGVGGAPGSTVAGTTGSGGAASGGTINIDGGRGVNSRGSSALLTGLGAGGFSPRGFGAGGVSAPNNSGTAGTGYGGGGGGAMNNVSQSARAGAAGTAGIVIIKEYF